MSDIVPAGEGPPPVDSIPAPAPAEPVPAEPAAPPEAAPVEPAPFEPALAEPVATAPSEPAAPVEPMVPPVEASTPAPEPPAPVAPAAIEAAVPEPAAPAPVAPSPEPTPLAPGPAPATRIVATASGPRFVTPGMRPGAGAPPAPVRPVVNTVPLMPLGIPIRPAVVTVTTVAPARPPAQAAPAPSPAPAPQVAAPAARIATSPLPAIAPSPAIAPPPLAKPIAVPPAAPTPAPRPVVVDAPAPRSSESMKAVRPRRTTERLGPRPAAPAPLLVAVGLGVGVLGMLAFQAVRRPPEPVVAPTPMVTTPVATDRPQHVPAAQRSPEQWLAWAHDEVSLVWRTAGENGGRRRAEARLLALSRELDDASGAEGADAVVRAARDQLRVLAGELPLTARPEQRPRDTPRRATEAAPPPEEAEPAPAPDEASDPAEPPPWMPRGVDEPRPVAEPGPDDVEARAENLWAARRLLLRLYDSYYKKDVAGAKALLANLEEDHADSPETHAGRGHFHFQEGRYVLALDALTRAGEVSLQAVHDRAFAALYLGRLDQVRALLDHEALQSTKLRLIVDGPFRARLPLAADALEARTDEGHYRVVTDLGLSRADLQALEQKLAAAGDAAGGAELVEKARKKHRGLKELGEVMEKAYKAYDKLFNIDRPGDVVPTVIMFSDRVQFDAFSGRLDLGSTENALGYYWAPYRILVFYDEDQGQRRGGGLVSRGTLETLLHETFHQWLDLYVDDSPRWFDEGLAEYFGISELTRTELRYGLVPQYQPSRLSNIRQAFSGDYMRPPLPLARFLTQDQRTFMGPQSTVNYAQAWSFVHYLGASPGGQRLLRDYFNALREGADVHAAYERVFAGLDLDAMEKEWRQHVGRMR